MKQIMFLEKKISAINSWKSKNGRAKSMDTKGSPYGPHQPQQQELGSDKRSLARRTKTCSVQSRKRVEASSESSPLYWNVYKSKPPQLLHTPSPWASLSSTLSSNSHSNSREMSASISNNGAMGSATKSKAGRSASNVSPSPTSIIESHRKTEMCRNYPRCPYGASCAFAHSQSELRRLTLEEMEESGRIPNKGKFRVFPCLTWVMTGACPYRDRCVFIHDPRVRGEQEAYLFATPGSNNAHLSSKNTPLWWPDLPSSNISSASGPTLPSMPSSACSSSLNTPSPYSSTAPLYGASATQYEVIGRDGGPTYFEKTVKYIWESYRCVMTNLPSLGNESCASLYGDHAEQECKEDKSCGASIRRLVIFETISLLRQQHEFKQCPPTESSWARNLKPLAQALNVAGEPCCAPCTGFANNATGNKKALHLQSDDNTATKTAHVLFPSESAPSYIDHFRGYSRANASVAPLPAFSIPFLPSFSRHDDCDGHNSTTATSLHFSSSPSGFSSSHPPSFPYPPSSPSDNTFSRRKEQTSSGLWPTSPATTSELFSPALSHESAAFSPAFPNLTPSLAPLPSSARFSPPFALTSGEQNMQEQEYKVPRLLRAETIENCIHS